MAAATDTEERKPRTLVDAPFQAKSAGARTRNFFKGVTSAGVGVAALTVAFSGGLAAPLVFGVFMAISAFTMWMQEQHWSNIFPEGWSSLRAANRDTINGQGLLIGLGIALTVGIAASLGGGLLLAGAAPLTALITTAVAVGSTVAGFVICKKIGDGRAERMDIVRSLIDTRVKSPGDLRAAILEQNLGRFTPGARQDWSMRRALNDCARVERHMEHQLLRGVPAEYRGYLRQMERGDMAPYTAWKLMTRERGGEQHWHTISLLYDMHEARNNNPGARAGTGLLTALTMSNPGADPKPQADSYIVRELIDTWVTSPDRLVGVLKEYGMDRMSLHAGHFDANTQDAINACDRVMLGLEASLLERVPPQYRDYLRQLETGEMSLYTARDYVMRPPGGQEAWGALSLAYEVHLQENTLRGAPYGTALLAALKSYDPKAGTDPQIDVYTTRALVDVRVQTPDQLAAELKKFGLDKVSLNTATFDRYNMDESTRRLVAAYGRAEAGLDRELLNRIPTQYHDYLYQIESGEMSRYTARQELMALPGGPEAWGTISFIYDVHQQQQLIRRNGVVVDDGYALLAAMKLYDPKAGMEPELDRYTARAIVDVRVQSPAELAKTLKEFGLDDISLDAPRNAAATRAITACGAVERNLWRDLPQSLLPEYRGYLQEMVNGEMSRYTARNLVLSRPGGVEAWQAMTLAYDLHLQERKGNVPPAQPEGYALLAALKTYDPDAGIKPEVDLYTINIIVDARVKTPGQFATVLKEFELDDISLRGPANEVAQRALDACGSVERTLERQLLREVPSQYHHILAELKTGDMSLYSARDLAMRPPGGPEAWSALSLAFDLHVQQERMAASGLSAPAGYALLAALKAHDPDMGTKPEIDRYTANIIIDARVKTPGQFGNALTTYELDKINLREIAGGTVTETARRTLEAFSAAQVDMEAQLLRQVPGQYHHILAELKTGDMSLYSARELAMKPPGGAEAWDAIGLAYDLHVQQERIAANGLSVPAGYAVLAALKAHDPDMGTKQEVDRYTANIIIDARVKTPEGFANVLKEFELDKINLRDIARGTVTETARRTLEAFAAAATDLEAQLLARVAPQHHDYLQEMKDGTMSRHTARNFVLNGPNGLEEWGALSLAFDLHQEQQRAASSGLPNGYALVAALKMHNPEMGVNPEIDRYTVESLIELRLGTARGKLAKALEGLGLDRFDFVGPLTTDQQGALNVLKQVESATVTEMRERLGPVGQELYDRLINNEINHEQAKAGLKGLGAMDAGSLYIRVEGGAVTVEEMKVELPWLPEGRVEDLHRRITEGEATIDDVRGELRGVEGAAGKTHALNFLYDIHRHQTLGDKTSPLVAALVEFSEDPPNRALLETSINEWRTRSQTSARERDEFKVELTRTNTLANELRGTVDQLNETIAEQRARIAELENGRGGDEGRGDEGPQGPTGGPGDPKDGPSGGGGGSSRTPEGEDEAKLGTDGKRQGRDTGGRGENGNDNGDSHYHELDGELRQAKDERNIPKLEETIRLLGDQIVECWMAQNTLQEYAQTLERGDKVSAELEMETHAALKQMGAKPPTDRPISEGVATLWADKAGKQMDKTFKQRDEIKSWVDKIRSEEGANRTLH